MELQADLHQQLTNDFTKDGENKSLLEKLASFSEFPQFWEEETANEYADPEQKAAEDREVEEFRRRLESINTDSRQRKSFEMSSFTKLKEICISALGHIDRDLVKTKKNCN